MDWKITALFYAALHYVDAYLATIPPTGVHPKRHGDRNWHLDAQPELASIARDYRELRDRSEDARYEALLFRPESAPLQSEIASSLWSDFGATDQESATPTYTLLTCLNGCFLGRNVIDGLVR